MNLNATANSPFDIYRHNPWRAPGNAPIADVCGLAGGTPWGTNAPEAGMYTNTTNAYHGKNGSTLPKLPTNTTWKIGGVATVTWQLLQNHGGGYSYRLCPSLSPLTEACFQSHPLDFVPHKSALLLPDGSKIPITPLHVNTGTQPPGSTWSRIPIPPTDLGPRCLPGPHDNASTPHACTPGDKKSYEGPCEPCPETPGSDCSRCGQSKTRPAFPPLANWTENQRSKGFQAKKGDPIQKGGFALGILDVLKIPADLPQGDYVLGWRYDCEATSQVWTNCAVRQQFGAVIPCSVDLGTALLTDTCVLACVRTSRW